MRLEAKIVIEENGNISFYSEEPGMSYLLSKYLDKRFMEEYEQGKKSVVESIIKGVKKFIKE